MEEQEYRILARSDESFYSTSNMGFIPRVKVAFDPSCISEIIVGPGDYGELRKRSVERYCDQHVRSYDGIAVTLSEVPYRHL